MVGDSTAGAETSKTAGAETRGRGFLFSSRVRLSVGALELTNK